MTGDAVLYMLFGAALVAIGVLATALADRIRGLRVSRDRAVPAPRTAHSRAPIEVIEAEVEPTSPRAASKPKAPNAEPQAQAMADDVITALVATGYKRPIAARATWSCSASDRATIESWTRAALRCAKGAVS